MFYLQSVFLAGCDDQDQNRAEERVAGWFQHRLGRYPSALRPQPRLAEICENEEVRSVKVGFDASFEVKEMDDWREDSGGNCRDEGDRKLSNGGKVRLRDGCKLPNLAADCRPMPWPAWPAESIAPLSSPSASTPLLQPASYTLPAPCTKLNNSLVLRRRPTPILARSPLFS